MSLGISLGIKSEEPRTILTGALRFYGFVKPFLWCREGDSNPHGLITRRILSPLRLPFRHPGWWYIAPKLYHVASAPRTGLGLARDKHLQGIVLETW